MGHRNRRYALTLTIAEPKAQSSPPAPSDPPAAALPDCSVPLIIGEWGGQWEDQEWNGRVFESTSRWQLALRSYITERELSGSFYWVRTNPTLVAT